MNKKKQNTNAGVSAKENRAKAIWHQFKKNKGAMIGLAVTIFIILVAIFADVIWDYDTDVIGMKVSEKFLSPCLVHPFGTDEYGRDMLARVGYGARYSLIIEDIKKPLYIGVDGEELVMHYGQENDADVVAKMSNEVMQSIIDGRMTFQRAFMTGEMTAKGNFKTLRMLDQVFVF